MSAKISLNSLETKRQKVTKINIKIYKTIALKYGATYTYNFSTKRLTVNIKNVKNPYKLISEMRKYQLLEQGIY